MNIWVDKGTMNIIYKYPEQTLETAEQALSYIPADLLRNDWIKIATALKTEFGDAAKETFLTWSSQADSYKRQDAISTWKSLKIGFTKINTLYWYAKQYGYTAKKRVLTQAEKKQYAKEAEQRRQAQQKRAAQDKAEKEADQQRAKKAINEIIPILIPAGPDSHHYLINKQSNGSGAYILDVNKLPKPSIARYTYPINQIANTKSGKALVIPFQNAHGEYVGMQCIYGGKKILVKGSIATGSYAYLPTAPIIETTGTIVIGEGYATVNSYLQACPYMFGVMAKDANNLPLVAQLIQDRHPFAKIIILGDNDDSGVGQKSAKQAASLVGGISLIPDRIHKGQNKGTDWNDVYVELGVGAIRRHSIALQGDAQTDLTNIHTLRESINYQDAYKKISAAKITGNTESIVSVCHRYALEGVVAAIDLGITSIKLHQDMKAGKTFLVGWLQKHHPEINQTLYASHLASINEATTNRLSFSFDLNFSNYKALKEGDYPDGTGTTFNSMPSTVNKLCRTTFDLLYIDETEGVAPFMANGSINNKAEAGEVLKEVGQKAKIVIVADAHMGSNTDTFLDYFMPSRSFTTLKNHYQHWKGVHYSWLDDRNEGLDYLKQRLLDDKPLFIYFTSAALAEYAYELCKEKGLLDGKKVLLASSSTANTQAVIDAKANNALFNTYAIVFASPILGIGLSIEGDYFHDALVFYSRALRTGNSQAALQMPFRTRDIKNITCVKVDNMLADYSTAIEIEKITERADQLIEIKSILAKQALNGDEEAIASYNWLAKDHLLYESAISANDAKDYGDYYDNINAEFQRKGMVQIPKVIVAPTGTVDDEIKIAKSKVKETRKQNVIYADDKTNDEIIAIKVALSAAPESVADDQRHALQKHDLYENFISTEALQMLEEEARIVALDQAWELKEQGVDRSRRRIQAALLPPHVITHISHAWTAGVGESHLMQKDIASNSAAHLQVTTAVDRLLMKYVGLTQDENGHYIMEEPMMINNSIARDKTKGRFSTKIAKLREAFNAVTDSRIITKIKIKAAPASLLVELIRNRLGLTVDKIRKPKTIIVPRQTIKTETCDFPEIAEAIIKPLNLRENGRMSAKNHIEINQDLLEQSGFINAITDDVRQYYNENKPAEMKIITQKQLDHHPIALFIRLASTLLGVKFDTIKPNDEWVIPTEQVVINNLNLATDKGLNHLLHLNTHISAELCLTEEGILNNVVKRELDITYSTEQHIKKCLKNIPAERHHEVLREYIAIVENAHKESNGFSPLRKANLFLLHQSEQKKKQNDVQKINKKSDSLPPFWRAPFWWQDSVPKIAIDPITVPIHC